MVCALSSDYHTRSLLGTSYSARPYDGETLPLHNDEETLDKAKQTLLDYAVVLTTDDSSEALPIVRHALRWRPWSLNEVLPVRDRQSGRKRSVVKRNLSAVDRQLLTARNRLDIALYAYARSLVKVDALFYSKAAEAGLFREDVRDPKRAFCGGGGEWMERQYGKDGQLVASHVVTPGVEGGEDEEGDLEFLEEE